MRREILFSGNYPNVHLIVLYILIVFALASLIDAGESIGVKTVYIIKDRGIQPTQATSKLNGIKQGLMLVDLQHVG